MAGWKIHENPRSQFGDKIYKLNGSLSMEHCQKMEICMGKLKHPTWWLIPLNKWVITPVISGISRINLLITGVLTHLPSGMSHQVINQITYGLGGPPGPPFNLGAVRSQVILSFTLLWRNTRCLGDLEDGWWVSPTSSVVQIAVCQATFHARSTDLQYFEGGLTGHP